MQENEKKSLIDRGYIPEKELGEGTFGKCYLVNSLKYNLPFACKIVNTRKFSEDKVIHIRQSWVNEKNILIDIDHPNLLRIYDFWENSSEMFIIIEYCDGDTVEDQIKLNKRIKEPELIRLALQICSAIEYLHSNGIVHHDIKPSNFLLDSHKNIKICDFGISSQYRSNEQCCTRKGTLPFMSPELLKVKMHNPFKDDIWALGVSLYYMAYGQLPWKSRTIEALIENQIFAPSYQKNIISSKLIEIISNCLKLDPMKRPDIHSIRTKFADILKATKSTAILPPLKMTQLGLKRVGEGVFLYSIVSPTESTHFLRRKRTLSNVH